MKRAISRGPKLLALVVVTATATAACATSTPQLDPTRAPRRLAARDVSGDEVAAWLQDNPTALARREAARREAEEQAELDAERAADEAARAEEAKRDEEAAKAPPACDAEMKKATAALETGDLDEAERWAKSVVARNPKDYPYAYVVLGDVALARGQHQAAYDFYAQAMALDPSDGWTVQRAAQALVKLGKHEEARKLLREWLTLHPDADADAWDALAWLEMDAGDGKRAKEAFENANRLAKGKDPEAWYGLALLAARRGDAKEVVRTLTELFALEPERRLVIERDPAFFRLRWYKDVAALFDEPHMAAARTAAKAKASGEKVVASSAATSGAPASATVTTTATTTLAVPGQSLSITGVVLFDTASAKLRPESGAVLDGVAKFLASNHAVVEWVEVSGHADKVGDEAFNVALSESRAKSVRDALIARGVDEKLLRARGYGEYCPLDDGDDPAALQRNRRVGFAVSAGGRVSGAEGSCAERMQKWLKPARGVGGK
jgi:outer membrane protein OmpA-like peptidoglycan-associated protein/Flp pilus assembly protein TadD